MTGVEERVKGFVESWRETHCSRCECELTDGNVAIVDGKLVCAACHALMRRNESTDGRQSKQP